jgi:hypothetical protein
MRASILLFRPDVVFFALALVVFGSVAALNAGESSAQKNDCGDFNPPDDYFCAGGGAILLAPEVAEGSSRVTVRICLPVGARG